MSDLRHSRAHCRHHRQRYLARAAGYWQRLQKPWDVYKVALRESHWWLFRVPIRAVTRTPCSCARCTTSTRWHGLSVAEQRLRDYEQMDEWDTTEEAQP